ncbi:type I secretion system permease/ATPase [Methylobacterium planeticum]|uniref:Type I secretion system permease/ATPase n=1 Tax=Methylobacterium planeticum TaxID=2615211 RepID=A0A6N6MV53_9HYPH|nr:type I secretion system permease/ATPase [Methylobacterium planeticum]KAB1075985.1 type I secretion system permease/ATPase [Methylobacterium planeticum]
MISSKASSILGHGVRSMRPALVTALVFGLFINVLLLASPLYMLQIYDRVLASRNEVTLVGLTVIVAVALLVCAVLEMLRSRILVRGGLAFDRRIAEPIFGAVHRGHLLRPEAGHGSALRDIDTVREFLTGPGLLAFCDAPWAPIFLCICFLLHPWFGWMIAAGGGAILSLALLNECATRTALARASRAGNAAGTCAQAALRNGEVIQAMGMLAAFRALWNGRHRDVLVSQARASDRSGLIVALSKFIRMFLQMMILCLGAYLAIQREITPGSMIAASILGGRALAPVEVLVANWRSFAAARISYARLKQLDAVAAPPVERIALPRPRGEIEAENLFAAAPGQRSPVLRGISFRLAPGTVLGVVGPSAAGKSSLARAMTGVWPLQRGTVRIDGADLAHWDPQALGRHLGYLPQDVELFAGTVAQNIARFQDLDAEAVIAVAEAAGCHTMIQELADGYNTQIGAGGYVLSGGQRQRIALARAMYGDPRFVVLDEPDASLDAAGEAALMRALSDLRRRGATVLIITHKVNLLAEADLVLTLEGGAVRSSGSPDEVLRGLARPGPVRGLVSVAGGTASEAATQDAPFVPAQRAVG